MPKLPNVLNWASLAFLMTAQAIRIAHLDTVQIDSFNVLNCKLQNDNIATLLRTLSEVLQPVVTDLSSSASSDAYTTFFKDVTYAPYVRGILSNIIKGASVLPEPGAPSSVPTLVCVDGQDQVTFIGRDNWVDAYTHCRSHVKLLAFALLKTPYIVVCPAFFTVPAIPVPSTASCYTIDRNRNRFVQNGKSLMNYQLWHLMHEIVHYYVYSTTQKNYDVHAINLCLALPGRTAIWNAPSYIYYAANVRLGCMNFPTVRTRPTGHGSDIEFLEVNANTTVLNTNESIALAAQKMSVQTLGDDDPSLTSRTSEKRTVFHG